MIDLTPPAWSDAIRQQILDEKWHLRALWNPRDENGEPATLVTRTPRPQAWLAGRAEFAKRWEALKAEGFEQGWLEWENYDYAGSSDIIVTSDTEVVSRDPNPAYRPTELPRSITIPIVRAAE